MSAHRLRAIADTGSFVIEIDADRTHGRVRLETLESKSEQLPAAETSFQFTPIDSNAVSVISESGERRAPGGQQHGGHEPHAAALRAYVVASGDTTWVFIDGETFIIDVEPAERARARRGASGNEGLAAPMPATVIKLLVEPGAQVQRGDVLLLLEAMKMELPIRAPRDGRVKALHCRPGELVQPGTALVDLE
jgi:biotin carboxyl carrier protein